MAICECAPNWFQIVVIFLLTIYTGILIVYAGNYAYNATLDFIGDRNPPDWKILLVFVFLTIVFFLLIRVGLNADALKIVKTFNFAD